MNNVLNLSLLEGRLTRDPEIYYTKNGNAFCKFDIAVNYKTKNGEKIIDDVSYIGVNTWNKVAENCMKYLKKGYLVRVKGRLKHDKYDAKDGTKKEKIKIEDASVDFLSSPKKSETTAGNVSENFTEKVPF
jgi:single-strand DNA-binding protein